TRRSSDLSVETATVAPCQIQSYEALKGLSSSANVAVLRKTDIVRARASPARRLMICGSTRILRQGRIEKLTIQSYATFVPHDAAIRNQPDHPWINDVLGGLYTG